MAFSSSFLIFFGLLSLELVSFFQFSVCFDLLSNSLSFPSSSFSEWHSLASRFNPEALTAVSAHLENDIQQVERKGKWKQLNTRNAQPSRPNGEEKVNLVVGVKHEDDKQKALDLLFQLVSDPRNAAPLNGVSLSISDGHSYAISRGVLSISTFVDDLFVMNSFPTLFPRFYGQHLSKAETDFLLTPKKEKVMAVENWLHSGGVDIQSECSLVSATRDYFSCQLSIHQYLRLIPFADLRVYRHHSDADIRVVKAFPSNPHQLLHHTEIYNPAAAALRTTDAIHYISGVNRWPMYRPKPGMKMSSDKALLSESMTLQHEQHAITAATAGSGIHSDSSSTSGTSVAAFSADDALMWLQSDNRSVLGYVQARCPFGTDLLQVHPTISQISCWHNGQNYNFTRIVVTPYFTVQYADVSPTVTETASTTPYAPLKPILKITGANTAAVGFRVHLPWNYVAYLLQIELYYEAANGDVITRRYNSTRPVTPQQVLNVNMLKTYYRWSESLVNSGNSANYWSQSIGAFWLTPANQGDWSPADLAQFLSSNGIDGNNATLVQAVGEYGNDPNPAVSDGETELDTQWMTGIASNVPTTVFHYNWFNETGFQYVLESLRNTSDDRLPTVLSISYGGSETSTVEGDYSEYAAVNILLALLGSRGISIFVSSGDNGAYENYNDYATAFNCSIGFDGSWPSTSPWVTSVGATQLAASQLTVQANSTFYYPPTEVACSVARAALITSGGGFSTLYPQPSWQQAAVSNYLNTAAQPPSSWFNSSNRAYPDISLLGRAYQTVLSGDNSWSDGTSASSPSFAAFISNVNQQRKAVGLKPLGFLNPILYQLAAQHPEAFNDITIGDNACAVGDYSLQKSICCPNGFAAAPGYDAVTGIGSPRWDVLGPLLVPTANANVFTYNGGYASFDGCDSTCFPATVAQVTTPAPAVSVFVAETHPIQGWEIALIVVLTFGLGIFLAYWCCANFNRVKQNNITQGGEHFPLQSA